MRTRILEGEDLWLLADVPGPFAGRRDVIAQLGNAQVVALEDGDPPRLLGYWPIWVAVHLDPLWLSPEVRKHPTAARQLLCGMQAALKAERITTAFAVIAHDDLVQNLLLAARIGFQRVPGDLFFVKLEETHGSSSGTGDLPGRAVLHEPGAEQAHPGRADHRDDGPPGLGD